MSLFDGVSPPVFGVLQQLHSSPVGGSVHSVPPWGDRKCWGAPPVLRIWCYHRKSAHASSVPMSVYCPKSVSEWHCEKVWKCEIGIQLSSDLTCIFSLYSASQMCFVCNIKRNYLVMAVYETCWQTRTCLHKHSHIQHKRLLISSLKLGSVISLLFPLFSVCMQYSQI